MSVDNENKQSISELTYSVIGNKIPNPLSLEIARKAFNLLSPETKSGFSQNDINATHRYVAFTPTNEDELYALYEVDEEQVVMYSYPLDYEVSDGVIVPDSRFMTNGYSYRWAYVPIDFDLSEIDCPYIYYYDIFSPKEKLITKSSEIFFDALEIKSYELCGIELTPTQMTKASKYIPGGQVTFFDKDAAANSLAFIGAGKRFLLEEC
ncbi:MAG: hypothetical protein K2J62_10450 [Bacteroidales bacterium]|nr:hypothetical protein [Bacteroidales bacterium]